MGGAYRLQRASTRLSDELDGGNFSRAIVRSRRGRDSSDPRPLPRLRPRGQTSPPAGEAPMREQGCCPDDRRLCRRCRAHRAIFLYRGRVGRDRMHDLCPACWTAIATASGQRGGPTTTSASSASRSTFRCDHPGAARWKCVDEARTTADHDAGAGRGRLGRPRGRVRPIVAGERCRISSAQPAHHHVMTEQMPTCTRW